MQLKDYYSILELHPSATRDEIKKAYRRLAHQYHPDKKNNDPYAAAQFSNIKEAYEILSNPVKKDQYLQQRWYTQSIGKKIRKEPNLLHRLLYSNNCWNLIDTFQNQMYTECIMKVYSSI